MSQLPSAFTVMVTSVVRIETCMNAEITEYLSITMASKLAVKISANSYARKLRRTALDGRAG
jgi:molybdopterin-binding protein